MNETIPHFYYFQGDNPRGVRVPGSPGRGEQCSVRHPARHRPHRVRLGRQEHEGGARLNIIITPYLFSLARFGI